MILGSCLELSLLYSEQTAILEFGGFGIPIMKFILSKYKLSNFKNVPLRHILISLLFLEMKVYNQKFQGFLQYGKNVVYIVIII